MPAAETKHISIVLGGSGEQTHDVEVQRGTTARDLSERLDLTGYLTRYGDPAPFGENEEVFSRVQDGDKLILAPKNPVAIWR